MGNRLLMVIAALLCCGLSWGQVVNVFHEVEYTDDGTIANYPSGHTTYRIYASLADGEDACYSVFAASGNTLTLGTESGEDMWNTSFGGVTGPDINFAFIPVFPEVAYDSMVTIGREHSGIPGGAVTTVVSIPDPQAFNNALASALPSGYNPNLYIEDGTWFGTPADANAYGVGADFRVLLAQVTTGSDIAYQLNLQLNDGGIGGEVLQYVWDSANAGDGQTVLPGLAYPPVVEAIPGCTDELACNYNAEATEDDGSCLTEDIVPETPVVNGSGAFCLGDDQDDSQSVTYEAALPENTLLRWVVIDEGGNQQGYIFTGTNTFNDSFGIDFVEGDGSVDYGQTYFNPPAGDPSPFSLTPGNYTVHALIFPESEYDCLKAHFGDTLEELLNDPCSPCVGASAGVPLTVSTSGCTDPFAENYDADACFDDGSCILPEPCVLECPEDLVLELGEPSDTTFTGVPFTSGDCQGELEFFDITEGEGCDQVITRYFELVIYGGDEPQTEASCEQTISFTCPGTPGCTDATACNYDETATEDDGSCEYAPTPVDPMLNGESPFCYGAGSTETFSVTYPGTIPMGSLLRWALVDADENLQGYIFTGESPSDEMPGVTFTATDGGFTYTQMWGVDPGSTGSNTYTLEAGSFSLRALIFDTEAYSCFKDHASGSSWETVIGGDCADCWGYSEVTFEIQTAGCTDPNALNYNEDACADDDSCEYPVEEGCTDMGACNYNPDANEDDGSCTYPGCIDPAACDYNELAGCDDGSCTYPGCTDDMACNYDPAAGCDDESCILVDGGFIDAQDTTICVGDGNPDVIVFTAFGPDFNPATAWVVTDADGTILAVEPSATIEESSQEVDFSLAPPGVCQVWYLGYDPANISGAAPGLNAADLTGCFALSAPISIDRQAAGCMDPEACNYDEAASCEDDSCIYVEPGTISNQDASVCVGDGSATAIEFSYSGPSDNPAGAWVITDADGTILNVVPSDDVSTSSIEIDFGPVPPGVCQVWFIVYDPASLTGAEAGANASDLGGCYELSAPVTITREVAGCDDPEALNYNPDACGNDGTCEYPDECELVCPVDVSVECNTDIYADNLAATGGYPEIPEGCYENAGWGVTDITTNPGECPVIIERIFSLFEEDVVVASCSQFITLVDTTAPVFTGMPEDLTVECIEDVPAPGEYMAEDDCGDVTVEVYTYESGNPQDSCDTYVAYGPGPDWALWLPLGSDIAPSPYWNLTSAGEFVTYDDGTAQFTGEVSNNGDASLVLYVDLQFENASSWEEWSAMGRDYKDELGLAAAGGNLWETWTYYEMVNGYSYATGVAGLEGTVQLSHAPVNYEYGFQCGLAANNKNDGEGASGWFSFEGTMNGQSVAGIGDVNIDKECEEVPTLSECPTDEVITYVWRAEDNCGNVAFMGQHITIHDTTAPEVVEGPMDLTVECDALDTVPNAEDEVIVAVDNCVDTPVTVTYEGEFVGEGMEGDCEYTVLRRWRVEDECGNFTIWVQTITIQDTTAPVFSEVPTSYEFECGTTDYEIEFPTATDNCGGEVEVEVDEYPASGTCEEALVYTFTATDDCGNMAQTSIVINFIDTVPPTIEADGDITIECDEVADLPDPSECITASDICDEDLEISVEEEIIEGFCEGNYTIVWTWTAEDDCGNTATATKNIFVQDTTAPTWVEGSLPEDVTVECSDEIPAVVYPEAEDNCDAEVTLELTETILPGDCPNNYTIERVFRGFDDCGNQVIFAQYITVQDTTAPELEVGADATIECDEEVPAASWTASDNCSEILEESVTEETIEGECAANYTLVRTYTVTDECGNTSVATQTINVQDTTGPVVINDAPTYIEAECGVEAEIIAPEWEDACSEIVSGGGSTAIEINDCGYTEFLTYTVTDACGNTSVFTQEVVYLDTTAPSLEIAADVTIECDQEVPAPEWTASDLCDSDLTEVIEEETVEGDCANNYTILRTYTVTDDCGLSTSMTQTITVQDTTAPMVEEMPEDITVECGDEVPTYEPVWSDNCDEELELTAASSTGLGECTEFWSQSWTATDDCGNTTTVSRTVTFVDTTAPELSVAGDVTIECDQEVPAPEWDASDACDDLLDAEITEVNMEGECANSYTIERTYTVTDNCGNSTSAVQFISVVDTTAPVWDEDSLPTDYSVECTEVADQSPEVVLPTATDNCGEILPVVTWEDEVVAGDCDGNYSVVRTFTATDECGNTSDYVQTITVQDTTGPVVINEAPAYIELECGDDSEVLAPEWADACSEIVSGGGSTSIDIDECGYTQINTYSATDACGNTSIFTQEIVYIDTTAPSLEIAADVTIECDEEVPAAEWTASDLCDDDLDEVIEEEIVEGDCASNYTILRTYTVTDDCGLSTSMTQIITVQDTTAPMVEEMPEDITVECGDDVPAYEPVWSDNCDEELELTAASSTGLGECTEFWSQSWTATDDCGNTTTVSRTVTFVDTTAPEVISAPEDITVECDEEVPYEEPVFEDVCDSELTIEAGSATGIAECGSFIERFWTATDDCGNSTTVTQLVTIVDTTAPMVVSAPEDVTIECDEEQPADAPVFEDNCDMELTLEAISGIVNLECGYLIEQAWTATDDCGNSATVTRVITVVDNTAPTITGNPVEVTSCEEASTFVFLDVNDNCDEDVEVTFEDEVIAVCPYTIIRTYTATDDCGNQGFFSHELQIVDETAPEFVEAPMDASYDCAEEFILDEPVIVDNCSEVMVDYTEELIQGNCPSAYTLIRTWVATDECENVSSHTQTITVTDMLAPEWVSVPEDMVVECDEDVAYGEPVAIDNCSEFFVNYDESTVEGDCASNYTILRTWTAIDACGNLSSVTQTITVQDTTAPMVEEMPEDITVECGDEVPGYTPVWFDNCDMELELTAISGTGLGECTEFWEQSWTATDDCGNSTTVSRTVTFVDTTAPVITGEEFVEVACDEVDFQLEVEVSDICDADVDLDWVETQTGECPITIERVYTATDNCGNQSTFTQIITSTDEEAPTVEVAPEDLIVECDEEIPTYEPVWMDNCDEELELSASSATGILECGYVIEESWTATDNCGNSTTVSRTIEVIDTTAPEVTFVPEDATFDCDVEDVEVPEPTFSDNCDEELTITVDGSVNDTECGYNNVWVWTATDDCGNSTSVEVIYTFEDQTAPVITGEGGVTISCEDDMNVSFVEVTDNCDAEVELSWEDDGASGSCAGSYIRVYTAIDDCGNASTFTQVISTIDETAPVVVSAPEDLDITCGEDIMGDAPVFEDNCSADLLIEYSESVEANACVYELVQTWAATDACGNQTSVSRTVTATDTTAPVFVEVPADGIYSCTEAAELVAVAEDACGNVTLTAVEDITSEGECAGTYTATITWIATDDCGNEATAVTNITVEDNQAPVWDVELGDLTYTCASDVPNLAEYFTATDACSGATEVVITTTTVLEEDECGNYAIFVELYTEDGCGNSAAAGFMIEVFDNVAPEFASVPADLVLDCGDEVPAPAEVEAFDNCGDEVTVWYSEEMYGDESTGLLEECVLSTPPALFPAPAWALWLQDFEGGEYYELLEGNFEMFDDSTAVISGSVVSTMNDNAGFEFYALLENGLDWGAWSTQEFPTDYKDDQGFAGDNYLDWMYYILSSESSLTGWGDLEGTVIGLEHAPDSYLYGFQVGEAANNISGGYGAGGWFSYSGTYNGAAVDGIGDFAFEQSCCPTYTIERTWCAVDCSGNETCYTQTISFEDLPDEPMFALGSDNTAPATDINIVGMAPNPTMDNTTVKFESKRNQKVMLEIYELNGRKVVTLFDSRAQADVIYNIDYSAIGLESGVYSVRLTSSTEQVVQKLIVNK